MRFRSILFTPGTHPERIQKAMQSGAAAVVVADLEDGVAPRDKIEARIAVRNVLLATTEGPATRAVRINAWPSGMAEEDLDVVLPARPDLVVVPKAQDPDMIKALDARLAAAEDEHGWPAGSIRLMLILETAAGILAAHGLALASERVAALCFGAEDLAADVGIRRSADNAEVSVPRAMVPLAAAASGVVAVDMITADFKDDVRLRSEAEQARRLGYVGKMCIHPAQLAVVDDAFAPTVEEKAWAQNVIEAARGVEDGGVVVVDGRMIDVPLIEQAKRILRDA